VLYNILVDQKVQSKGRCIHWRAMMAQMTLHINGVSRHVDTSAEKSLLRVLRDDLALTGSKYGCGEGQCGACTVLIDGRPTRSCITPVGSLVGQKVQTIEGLEKEGQLHPVQEAFLDVGAMQCGYCTAGMIMSGVALLQKNPDPTKREIVRFMQGNVCRCGTYPQVVAAIDKAAHLITEGQDG
jgi:aerobic-type carbon monoxide dehydrogenase small subunit (CoxS/CutS family)